MKLVVNGEVREIDGSKYENFNQLLRELQSEFKGMVLSSLKINSREIPMSRLDELKPAKIDEGVEEIEMEFKPIREFLVDTLEEVIKYVDNVINRLPKVSEDMIVDTQKGYKAVKDITDGLNAVESLRENTIKASGIVPEDVGMKGREEEVMGILRNFVANLEKNDIIELSDMIENQLPKVLRYYRDYFSKVLEILKSKEN